MILVGSQLKLVSCQKTLTRRLVFETQEYEPHLNFFEICAYLMQLFNVVLELEL